MLLVSSIIEKAFFLYDLIFNGAGFFAILSCQTKMLAYATVITLIFKCVVSFK